MAEKNYKGHNGILGSRLIQDREVTAINGKTGETVGTFKAEPGSNVLKWREEADGTQLKFDIHNAEILDITDDDLTIDYMSSNPDYDGITPIWLYADPVIFDDETKAKFLTLPMSERPQFTVELIEKFYKARPEYNTFARRTIYEKPIELLNFFKSLTLEDFESCDIGNAAERFKLIQFRIETIEKTSTSGLVDTYTITLSNGNTSTFTVTNGQSFTVPQNAVVYYTGDEIPEGYEDTKAPPSGSGAEINDNVPTLSTTFSGVKIDTLVGRILTGTLTAGQTTLVLSDASIDSDTIIANIYVDTFGANPESITVATGSITLTFTAMVSDLSVKVRII